MDRGNQYIQLVKVLYCKLPTIVKQLPMHGGFYQSTKTSVKQFGYSFAFDAPSVWNALPDETRLSPFVASVGTLDIKTLEHKSRTCDFGKINIATNFS